MRNSLRLRNLNLRFAVSEASISLVLTLRLFELFSYLGLFRGEHRQGGCAERLTDGLMAQSIKPPLCYQKRRNWARPGSLQEVWWHVTGRRLLESSLLNSSALTILGEDDLPTAERRDTQEKGSRLRFL
jgi:hypothetical protein